MSKDIIWLKSHQKYMSIRAIEKDLCMPRTTLSKAVSDVQTLPKKWNKPLESWLENMF